MELNAIAPHVTATAMQNYVVNIHNHPLMPEILSTICEVIDKAKGKKSCSITVTNIRGTTSNRLDSIRYKEAPGHEDAKALLEEQRDRVPDTRLGRHQHYIKNPRRWPPILFREAVQLLCDTELKQRGFNAIIVQKQSKKTDFRSPTPYSVLEVTWGPSLQ